MARCGMITTCATILCIFVFHATSSTDVDGDSKALAGCRRLCSDDDKDNMDPHNLLRCVLACRQTQDKETDKDEQHYSRSSRLWFFPGTSRWQTRMLASGIVSERVEA